MRSVYKVSRSGVHLIKKDDYRAKAIDKQDAHHNKLSAHLKTIAEITPNYGRLKFSSNKEFAEYCATKAFEEKGCKEKDFAADISKLHYFPKSDSELRAMLNYDGKLVGTKRS